MIVPYAPEGTPSPRAQELGERLALIIAEYQQKNPDVSAEEIRVAAQIATGRITARRSAQPAVLAGVIAAAAALGGLLWFARGTPGEVHVPWIVIGAAAIVVVAVLAGLRNRS